MRSEKEKGGRGLFGILSFSNAWTDIWSTISANDSTVFNSTLVLRLDHWEYISTWLLVSIST